MEALATGRAAGALEERSLAHRRVAAHGARARRGGRPTVLRRHLAEAPLTASAARPRHAAASSLATSRWLCAAATAAAAAPAAPGVAWRWTGATATRPAAGGARLLSAGRRRLGRAAHLRDHGQCMRWSGARLQACTCLACAMHMPCMHPPARAAPPGERPLPAGRLQDRPAR